MAKTKASPGVGHNSGGDLAAHEDIAIALAHETLDQEAAATLRTCFNRCNWSIASDCPVMAMSGISFSTKGRGSRKSIPAYSPGRCFVAAAKVSLSCSEPSVVTRR